MTQHRRLVVWQKAMHLTEEIYRVTVALPSTERFGLVTQMRRSCISIPSNIAEGCGRRSWKDRRRFLDVAYGSLLQLETQLEVSWRLGYVTEGTLKSLIPLTSEIGQMLNGLKRSLRPDSDHGSPITDHRFIFRTPTDQRGGRGVLRLESSTGSSRSRMPPDGWSSSSGRCRGFRSWRGCLHLWAGQSTPG